VGESGGGGGIGEIIGGDIDSLHGGDGSLLSGGNSFLEGSQIGGQGGLISDGGGDTSQQGGHFRTGLGESENVINEQKHVFSFLVSEILSDGESGESHSGSGSRGLVHLSVDQGASRSGAIGVDHTRGNHFVVEVVSFSGSLSDSSEHRVTTMGLGDVIDQFLNKHGFTDSGSSEQADLSSSGVGGQQVDDLNSGDQKLSA
jgi:peptide chain release factor 1